VTSDELVEKVQIALSNAGLSNVVTLDCELSNGEVSLDRIDSKVRGQGNGKRALECFLSICDEHCLDIRLIVRPLDDSTDKAKLIAWYVRNDFVFVDGQCSKMRRKTCHRLLSSNDQN